ncbi:MAG: leucine-rich repeat domain-containing protein [bacterium]|nr:leucine-rich repeat domain-containing protein [bacterium]
MKFILCAISSVLASYALAQCQYCTNLDEALKNPSEVKHLNLSGQGLEKLPDSLHLFVNLETLDLSNNRLTDLDFGKAELAYLESLNLNFNPGVDLITISDWNKILPDLKELRARGCSIFLVSAELGSLKQLTFLDLSNNKLRTLPNSLSKGKLQDIRVRNNDIDNAFWAAELWSLHTLDVSGNEKLNLEDLGHSLLFKNLNKVIVSPSTENDVHKVFGKIDVETLVVRGGGSGQIAKSIPFGPFIKNVKMEGVSIESDKFYNWFNDFERLESIEFVNMELPAGLSSVKTSKRVILDLCSMQSSADLNNFSPDVLVQAVNMRGISAAMSGTAPNNLETENAYGISEAMINNKVPKIVAPEAFKETVSAQTETIVTLENSAYFIPKNAFLTASGDVYKGEVSVEITEYNDAYTNALAGAPMVYRDAAGDQIFSSAGMIEFRAYDDDGNALAPNPKSEIQVEMIDLQPSEDTRLYVFSEDDSNWVDIGEPTPSGDADLRQKILDSLNQLPDEYFFQVNPVQPDFTMDVKRSRSKPYEFTFNTARQGFIPNRFKELRISDRDFQRTYEDMEWIATEKNTFVLDTLITDEMDAIFKEIEKEGRLRGRFYKRRRRGRSRVLPIPGTMRELKLEANFEKDNFELSFKYRDTLIRVPVIFKEKGSIERIQRKEKTRFVDFDRVKGRAKKARKEMDEEEERAVKEGAQRLREARADYLSDPDVQEWQKQLQRQQMIMEVRNRETYRFGLSEFGMVNCDYFTRNRVDEYIKSTKITFDQNGEAVNVPNDIRTVIPEENVYVFNQSDRVPIMKNKKVLSFFAIGLTKLAIIIGWEKATNGEMRPIVETHDTEGQSPEEIKKMLQKY